MMLHPPTLWDASFGQHHLKVVECWCKIMELLNVGMRSLATAVAIAVQIEHFIFTTCRWDRNKKSGWNQQSHHEVVVVKAWLWDFPTCFCQFKAEPERACADSRKMQNHWVTDAKTSAYIIIIIFIKIIMLIILIIIIMGEIIIIIIIKIRMIIILIIMILKIIMIITLPW